ncbi:glycosyltransferase family protein [Spirosoma flavum]|uniref:Glycosyltransferase n=1 Tax=Spirosoma flavum TaxID=2048557 RepID=A0ABW6AFR8_9BACT
MSELAPILLFTYKRLDTLKQTIYALQQNYLASESELFIFSDAAKTDYDIDIIKKVRAYLSTINGFKRVTIYEAVSNKGLANSIIDGVTQIIKQYEKVIVLEDDLKTTPNFLSYMNSSLDTYEYVQHVFSVSGYSFNLKKMPDNESDAYFLNRGWSWGWSTWKDRWNKVDWLVEEYPDFCKSKTARKDFAKGGSDLNKMLKKQMTGKLDSWAIRWFYHQLKIHGLTVYPTLSKVYNNGFDKDATHNTGSSKRYQPLMDSEYRKQFIFPDEIHPNTFYQNQFKKKMGIRARIISKVEGIFKQIFKFI